MTDTNDKKKELKIFDLDEFLNHDAECDESYLPEFLKDQIDEFCRKKIDDYCRKKIDELLPTYKNQWDNVEIDMKFFDKETLKNINMPLAGHILGH
jgi:hypothetical protein